MGSATVKQSLNSSEERDDGYARCSGSQGAHIPSAEWYLMGTKPGNRHTLQNGLCYKTSSPADSEDYQYGPRMLPCGTSAVIGLAELLALALRSTHLAQECHRAASLVHNYSSCMLMMPQIACRWGCDNVPATYTDGTILFTLLPSSSTADERCPAVQTGATALAEWGSIWRVQFEPSKSQTMTVSRQQPSWPVPVIGSPAQP